jgi:hypothetical protein
MLALILISCLCEVISDLILETQAAPAEIDFYKLIDWIQVCFRTMHPVISLIILLEEPREVSI